MFALYFKVKDSRQLAWSVSGTQEKVFQLRPTDRKVWTSCLDLKKKKKNQALQIPKWELKRS